jgi:hypothetical protein
MEAGTEQDAPAGTPRQASYSPLFCPWPLDSGALLQYNTWYYIPLEAPWLSPTLGVLYGLNGLLPFS